MYRIFECITQEHSYSLLALAVVVCVSGSFISVLLTKRLTAAKGRRRLLHLILTSFICGATIWSTHFLAMLAYDPGVEHGYEPIFTGVSLAAAFLGLVGANAILAYVKNSRRELIAGAVFGLTISLMHFLGMSAYQIPGALIWHSTPQAVSVMLGAVLGAVAYRQIVRPAFQPRWLAGTIPFVGAICAMHFTAMSAFTISLDPNVTVPPQLISDGTLGLLIVSVTIIIFLIGLVAFSIESNMELETQAQLQHAALHDPLTGLANRAGLARKMAEISDCLAQDETEKVAVLTIDLNLFKQVNDLHGHVAGDAVLSTLGVRFIQGLNADEFIARSGGDEFVAIKRGFRRMDQVIAFAERLHALIVEPIDIEDINASVGAAIGIATTLEDGRDMEHLQHKSDVAMYRAKSEPECHICLFNAEIDRQSQHKTVMINDLRQALSSDQFELVYQLQNSINSLEATGFEVLLRWNHPERGRISPVEFIPLAEETGLIREIGLWVLRTACAEAASWQVPYDIAVNVAPQQLVQPSFVEQVMDILMETGLAPERLELEVTEASIIDDQANTLKVMHKLKAIGIRIAMDDFGTGYSSLATLKAFPFDKIKIDRSFVQDVHLDEQRAAIVRSTLILGDALKIPVLAEGVEIEDELKFLKSEDCDAVQGYYFGQPLSYEEMRSFVEAQEKRKAS